MTSWFEKLCSPTKKEGNIYTVEYVGLSMVILISLTIQTFTYLVSLESSGDQAACNEMSTTNFSETDLFITYNAFTYYPIQ